MEKKLVFKNVKDIYVRHTFTTVTYNKSIKKKLFRLFNYTFIIAIIVHFEYLL